MKVVGYTYRADNYCPACMAVVFRVPGATRRELEHHLDVVAEGKNIDRYDEWTYDSDEHPKVIFSRAAADTCGECGEDLQETGSLETLRCTPRHTSKRTIANMYPTTTVPLSVPPGLSVHPAARNQQTQ